MRSKDDSELLDEEISKVGVTCHAKVRNIAFSDIVRSMDEPWEFILFLLDMLVC